LKNFISSLGKVANVNLTDIQFLALKCLVSFASAILPYHASKIVLLAGPKVKDCPRI
jgi:hypothetical protein